MSMRPKVRISLLLACLAVPALAQQQSAPPRPTIDPRLYAGLSWRNVGPFRGGRVSATAGAIQQPGVFYAGYPGGGVWKTMSAGATWFPVFDSVRDVSSIGSVEVAPSNPDVVYVGTGDMITAGTIEQATASTSPPTRERPGSTSASTARSTSRRSPSIPGTRTCSFSPRASDPHRKSEERGIFRSTDGGRTPSKLFAGLNVLTMTTDAGAHWTTISPDFALRPEAAQANPPRPAGPRDGIVSLALSPVAPGTIWVGSNNGLIHLTRDEGKDWTDVSIVGLPTPARGQDCVLAVTREFSCSP